MEAALVVCYCHVTYTIIRHLTDLRHATYPTSKPNQTLQRPLTELIELAPYLLLLLLPPPPPPPPSGCDETADTCKLECRYPVS